MNCFTGHAADIGFGQFCGHEQLASHLLGSAETGRLKQSRLTSVQLKQKDLLQLHVTSTCISVAAWMALPQCGTLQTIHTHLRHSLASYPG